MPTHDAPFTAFSARLIIGQSETASLPSIISSVSWYGAAADPLSKWSLQITTGALTVPFLTSSLMTMPIFAQSLLLNQQLLAGRPGSVFFSLTSLSHFTTEASLLKSLIMALSISSISDAFPDSATHLKGILS